MERALKWIHICTYAAGGILVLYLLALVPGTDWEWIFFNSDTLYLSSIYTDLFMDGTGVEGWRLNSAPNFFPEMPLYWGLMALLKKHALTSLVYSIVQFAAVMFLAQWFFRTVDPKIRTETVILLNATFLLLILSPILGAGILYPFQLLISGYHCGYLINMLLAGITGFTYLRTGKSPYLVLTGIVVVLASLSDRIFLMGFVLPALVISLLAFFRKANRVRYLLFAGVTVVGAYLGMKILQWLDRGSVIDFFGTGKKMYQFDQIGPSFRNLFEYMGQLMSYPLQRWHVILPLLFITGGIIYLCLNLTGFIRDRLPGTLRDRYTLILFLMVSALLLFVTPAMNGYWLGPAHIRYNFPTLILGSAGDIYLLTIYLDRFSLKVKILQYTAIAVGFLFFLSIVILGFRHNISGGVREFVNHYPERSRILDDLKEPHDLKYGISNYWTAKYATTFSRNHVRVYAIHLVDLKPYYHVINENWYHDGGKGVHADPVFNFIYTDFDPKMEALLTEKFGGQRDTIYMDRKQDVLVLKLPEFKFDRETRQIFLLDPDPADKGSGNTETP